MIKIFDYKSPLEPIRNEIWDAVDRVLDSGRLILGPETDGFEKEFREYTGSKFCVGVNSGTSALTIALMGCGIGIGDEVITVSNTCVPTVAAIEMTGASPVFVDVNEEDLLINTGLIRGAITERTKAIIPVHLWGQSADLDEIINIAKEYRLKVIEDCAQATGTYYKGAHVGTFGDIGCFSFYPTKNLGAYGDAGALITNNKELAETIRKMRMYGYDQNGVTILKGSNFRISEIQSAILSTKLKYLPGWLKKRRETAEIYLTELKNEKVRIPAVNENTIPSYHQYVVRTGDREGLCEQLRKNEIGFGIHYPVPVHKMPHFKEADGRSPGLPVTDNAAGEILSIPVHESLKSIEIEKIIETINSF